MFGTRSTHNLKAGLLVTFGFLTATAHAATKVAVINAGVDPPGQSWCALLNDNGYECTLFPASGPTQSLASFALVINMSDEWTDDSHLLAEVMTSGRGVITWGWAPVALGVSDDPVVQAWVGANFFITGTGDYCTTVFDPILGDRPPGTFLGGVGKFGAASLHDTTGHDQAKVLARFECGTSTIALLRNRWESGRSVYFSAAFSPGDPDHTDIILGAVADLSRQIPASSTWGLVVLTLSVLTGGTIFLRRGFYRSDFSSATLVKPRRLRTLELLVLFVLARDVLANATELRMTERDGQVVLQLDENAPFYSTDRAVQNQRVIPVEGSNVILVIWEEVDVAQGVVPMYAVFPDGVTAARITETTYQLELRYQRFDPKNNAPEVVEALRVRPDGRLFVVQFYTQPLAEFHAPLAARGTVILGFLPHNAVIVRMEPGQVDSVIALPFVRSLTSFHPAYRVENRFLADLVNSPDAMPSRRYSVQLVDNALGTFAAAEAAIADVGAVLIRTIAPAARLEFRATGPQLLSVLRGDEVLFVDAPGAPGQDMDRARDYGGAEHVEFQSNFTGQGVRGEVMDQGVRVTHSGLQTPLPPIIHGTNPTNPSGWNHGTQVYGIIFGDETEYSCDSSGACGRGVLPDAQGIFAPYLPFVTDPPTSNRYNHTSQLVRADDCAGDPLCPYEAVFQSNSWGQAHRLQYTTYSSEMDQIVLDLDISSCQSQGNCGRGIADLCQSAEGEDPLCVPERECSRPEAWSKNVISVGFLYDFPSGSPNDHRNDRWCHNPPPLPYEISCNNQTCGSRGPAIDGRVKPDLVNFGDCIRTATWNSDTNYTSVFGATSAATPITCGYAGLVFQMWHEGVFKVWNGTTWVTTGGGASVFADRPHPSTVKAMLINTAYRYPLVTEPPNYRPDFTRDNMGWGMVDIAALYEQRETMFIVNETDVLTEFQTKSYTYNVASGSPALRVTLVYTDPPGCPNSTINLVNDLSLKVTSPTGTNYWGNLGLVNCPACVVDYFVGNWSISSTAPTSFDHINNMENVFIKNPASGNWTITVIADAINEDGHEETPQDDADFALVVSSAERPRGRCCQTVCGPPPEYAYSCSCSWTSKADCTGIGKVWSSEATCADACGTICPNICIE